MTDIIVESADFEVDGRPVTIWTLVAAGGVRMRVMNYGGVVLSIEAPDRAGRLADITLGYRTPQEYAADDFYFGALVGRVANRVAQGRAPLGADVVELERNAPPHHLHGGTDGFHRVVWEGQAFSRAGEQGIVLTHQSPHGASGYPGSVQVQVTYTLSDANVWTIDYAAEADRRTLFNPTHHCYFNLAASGGITSHLLQVPASHFLPVTPDGIPTGELRPVDRTAFDFRRPTELAPRLAAPDPLIAAAGGLDHCLVLSSPVGADGLRDAAHLEDPVSGRTLTVRTTAPALQLYSSNFLAGVQGRREMPYAKWDALCLETQYHPDAPNHAAFPTIVLEAGARFTSRTTYAFGVSAGA